MYKTVGKVDMLAPISKGLCEKRLSDAMAAEVILIQSLFDLITVPKKGTSRIVALTAIPQVVGSFLTQTLVLPGDLKHDTSCIALMTLTTPLVLKPASEDHKLSGNRNRDTFTPWRPIFIDYQYSATMGQILGLIVKIRFKINRNHQIP